MLGWVGNYYIVINSMGYPPVSFFYQPFSSFGRQKYEHLFDPYKFDRNNKVTFFAHSNF